MAIAASSSVFQQVSFSRFEAVQQCLNMISLATGQSGVSPPVHKAQLLPIYSFEIGDCITLFGRGFDEGDTVKTLIGYHISIEEDEEEIDDFLGGCEKLASYDFYLIGGDASTTLGEKCLLDKIRRIVNRHFPGSIKDELVGINNDQEYEGDTLKVFCSAMIANEGPIYYTRFGV